MDDERERQTDGGASERADEMEHRARRMEGRSSELEGDIAGAREEWDSKKTGGSAPGAQTEEAASDLVDESEEPEGFDLSSQGDDGGGDEGDDGSDEDGEEDDGGS